MNTFTRTELELLNYKQIRDHCTVLGGPKFLKSKADGVNWLVGKKRPDANGAVSKPTLSVQSPAKNPIATPNVSSRPTTNKAPTQSTFETPKVPTATSVAEVSDVSIEDLNRAKQGTGNARQSSKKGGLSPYQLTKFNSQCITKSVKNPSEEVLNLLPHEENLNMVIANSSSSVKARVISFQGVTHAGKSTIMTDLIRTAPKLKNVEPDIFEPNTFEPTVASTGNEKATSSGIRYYPSTCTIDGTDERAIFLDIEGHAAGNSIPVDDDENVGTLPEAYGKMRRGAVNEQLPRMAYVSSDVIILVDRNGFSTNTFVQRVREIAVEYALTGVMEAERPSLILVANCTDFASEDLQLVTDEYLKEHDPPTKECPNGVLRSFYLDVACINIPHKRFLQKEYNEQISNLHALIGYMLKRQEAHKQKVGTSGMSECLWAIMFKKCITKVALDRPIFMSRILAETISEISGDVVEQAKRLPMSILESVPAEVSFLEARKHAMKLLAVYLSSATVMAISDIHQANHHSREVVMSSSQITIRREEAYKMAFRLHRQLDEFAPCTSMYNTDLSKTKVVCMKFKHNHGEVHENKDTEMEYSKYSVIDTFTRFKRKLFNQSLFANWQGEFENPSLSNSEAWYAFWEVFDKLNTRYEITMEELLIAQLQITKAAVQYVNDSGCILHTGGVCLACFRNPATVAGRCGHKLCVECSPVIRSMDRPRSVLDGDIVSENCPVCRKPL